MREEDGLAEHEDWLQVLLLEGLETGGRDRPATPEFWEELRDRLV